MTYNINAGRYHDDGLEAIAKVIEAAKPDIAGLQEVDKDAHRTGVQDQAEWLAGRLGMNAVFAPALAYPEGGEYGVALLTRHCVVSNQCIELPHVASEALRRRMPAAIQDHADEPRVALAAKLEVGSRVLKLIVTRFGLTADQRLAQAETVGRLVKGRRDGEAVVLMGDLNARPYSPELKMLALDLTDACAATPDAARATRRVSRFDPADLPEISRHIDYVLISGDIDVLNADVIQDDSMASDHMPVIADLRLA